MNSTDENYAVTSKNDRSGAAFFEGTEKQVAQWITVRERHDDLDVYIPGEGYVSAAEFMAKVHQFVPKFYAMDPETEDLLLGYKLKNGMKVLIESPNERNRPEGSKTDWEMERTLENNRWCTVTELEFYPSENAFVFIGVYEDGTKRRRTFKSTLSWYVKKDSIAEVDRREVDLRGRVQQIVDDTVRQSLNVVIDIQRMLTSEKTAEIKELIEEGTREILDIL